MNSFLKFVVILAVVLPGLSASAQNLLSDISFIRETKAVETSGAFIVGVYADTDFASTSVDSFAMFSPAHNIIATYSFQNAEQFALIDIHTRFNVIGIGSTVPVAPNYVLERGENGNTPIAFHLNQDTAYAFTAMAFAGYSGESTSSTSVLFQLYRVDGSTRQEMFSANNVGFNGSDGKSYSESGILMGGYDYELLSTTEAGLFYYNLGSLAGESRTILTLGEIPEPGTYAAIIGAAGLTVAVVRRRVRAVATNT